MHQVLSWLTLFFSLIAVILWFRGTVRAMRDPARFCVERQPWMPQSLTAGGLALACWLVVSFWMPESKGSLQANAAAERHQTEHAPADRHGMPRDVAGWLPIFQSATGADKALTAEGTMADPHETWSNAAIADLGIAAAQGKTAEDIAKILGRPVNEVEAKAKELGLPLTRHPPG